MREDVIYNLKLALSSHALHQEKAPETRPVSE